MKQRDIILVPFPFTDLSSRKTRPALIISKGSTKSDFVVVAITSKNTKPSIQIETKDLQDGELPVTSFVRYDKIVTLHSSLVKQVVASLAPRAFRKIIREFMKLF